MRVAVVGSRSLKIENIKEYLPKNTTEIISGGAKGIDTCVASYAKNAGIVLTEIKPDYNRYKRGAPLVRNKEIVRLAEFVLIFWDGKSKGTEFVINECKNTGKKYNLIVIQ
ncbi:MAG: DUF2493 domain-containing protein [Ruminococcaceae bacterium]|nr:DUF2493 domain-containing protein [Oscillospiraceae bacterium]